MALAASKKSWPGFGAWWDRCRASTSMHACMLRLLLLFKATGSLQSVHGCIISGCCPQAIGCPQRVLMGALALWLLFPGNRPPKSVCVCALAPAFNPTQQEACKVRMGALALAVVPQATGSPTCGH
eukprot:1146379-Pelagomonas_calceolata.AAC.1